MCLLTFSDGVDSLDSYSSWFSSGVSGGKRPFPYPPWGFRIPFTTCHGLGPSGEREGPGLE